jgi:phage FluMu protein Com
VKYKVKTGNGSTVYTAICYRCEEVLKEVGSFAQKYCPDCKPIVDREKSRERMKKFRDKNRRLYL